MLTIHHGLIYVVRGGKMDVYYTSMSEHSNEECTTARVAE